MQKTKDCTVFSWIINACAECYSYIWDLLCVLMGAIIVRLGGILQISAVRHTSVLREKYQSAERREIQ